MTRYRIIETFVGPLALIEQPDGELEVLFTQLHDEPVLGEARLDPKLQPALVRKLTRYFDGKKVDFDDEPLPSGPPFYRACWRACRAIPYGQTRSYSQLAVAAGSPRAVRAAGQAMRNNPVTVITPCHRVVAADNALHGYSGSTEPGCAPLDIKERLLVLEGAIDAPMYQTPAATL